MSLALGHFAIGATGMTLLLAFLPVRVPFKRTFVLFGGIWALLPDIYKLELAYTGWMRTVHDSAAGNLFWFHRTLDVVDPFDSYLVAAFAVGLWVVTTAVVELTSALWSIFMDRRAERGIQLSD